MGFLSSRSEPDIWMKLKGDMHKYIAVYRDDISIITLDPSEKSTYHLGMVIHCDKYGVLCLSLSKYIG